ncbi:hypothetical protein [Sphingomonas montana]|uniref:hypothetical protein n=1 Tax=Sphingomonas montana TaxID=1843236 RepID=UPI00096D1BF9|nr:hypothetical protein [Sphingomonas montana]
MILPLVRRPVFAGFVALSGLAMVPGPAAASYLFWTPPNFTGTPVRGDEPGLGLPMPGATPKEYSAHLLWNMRAGLNVAALQCQFAPPLAAVKNYNTLLKQHDGELNSAYETVTGYFKRTMPKGWQVALDQYTTKTYNGFSTLHAQLGFCETAAAIGRDAIGRERGKLHETAELRMREFRNSLVPMGDGMFLIRRTTFASLPTPPLDTKCWNKRDELVKKCIVTWNMTQAAAGRPVALVEGAANPNGV